MSFLLCGIENYTRIDAMHQWDEPERALISMKLINEVEGNVT